MMKILLAGAVVIGVLFVALSHTSGSVEDKRALGDPGSKTFQIQVVYEAPVQPYETWVTVSESAWDRCRIDAPYPACAG